MWVLFDDFYLISEEKETCSRYGGDTGTLPSAEAYVRYLCGRLKTMCGQDVAAKAFSVSRFCENFLFLTSGN